MITFSAFADEIGPDLKLQMDVCEANGVRCIDVRGIDGKNVSAMSADEVGGYRRRMDDRGFRVPCIGSPLGKIHMDEDFGKHLDMLQRCFDAAAGFGTKLIRVFSFYPSQGKKIADERAGVLERLSKMVALAEKADMILMHENEKAIYGAIPQNVVDLFGQIRSKHFLSIFDPANFVEEGIAPYEQGWTKGLKEITVYFHIKDKKASGGGTCVPAGEGDGQIDRIFADLKKSNWSGYMTLEPHMAAAGKFSGYTGPDLFARAVQGLKNLCDQAGLEYLR
jgi:sugar phosphate isomerase/epimerase